jgi:hypothetical protein
MPEISALGRLRQEAVSLRPAWATSVSKIKNPSWVLVELGKLTLSRRIKVHI